SGLRLRALHTQRRNAGLFSSVPPGQERRRVSLKATVAQILVAVGDWRAGFGGVPRSTARIAPGGTPGGFAGETPALLWRVSSGLAGGEAACCQAEYVRFTVQQALRAPVCHRRTGAALAWPGVAVPQGLPAVAGAERGAVVARPNGAPVAGGGH